MTDLVQRARQAVTTSSSFSFYLPAARTELMRPAASLADALTVAGPKGPEVVRKLRDAGFANPVLFDGQGYAGKDLPPVDRWIEAQTLAGADRVVLPGIFVPWDKDDNTMLTTVVSEQGRIASDCDATILIAVDARWLAKRTEFFTDALRATERPIAIVLAHRADPLSIGGAVLGLRWLATRVPQLSLFRCDHGAIGALAFGAVHASMGLATSTRHFATSAMNPHRLPGNSARLFVRALLDWFRASDIAGWTAAGRDIICPLQCCRGESLAGYLDDDLNATWHNMNALADFADLVLNADTTERSIEFLNACRVATSRYGLAGFKGPEHPKAQLTGWALS